MATVAMPDGTLVEMPDKISPEQAVALAKLQAGAGPAASRESLLAARDAAQASANDARAAKYGKKSGWLFDATSPELEAANAKLKAFDEDELRHKADTGDVWDKVKYWGSVALGGAARGLGSMPAMAAAAGKAEARLSDFRNPEGYNPGAPLEDLSKVGFQPKTKGEKYVAAATDGAAAALTNPGGVGKNLLIGTTSGLGSEGAAQTFGDNAITRIVGALLAGGAPTLAMSLKPNSDKLLRQAVSQVPEQDWRRATALEQTLNANDIPHLKSQLLGDKSTLSDLVAVASTHPSVRPAFIAAVEQAPEQSRKAFEVWKNTNMPVAVDETRSVLGNIQQTAADRISTLKGQANDAFTAAVPPGTSASIIDPARVDSGLKALRTMAADPNYFGRLSEGGQFLNGIAARLEAATKGDVPLTVGEVNNLLKTLNTVAEKEGYKGVAVQTAKGVLKDMTPEFNAAREAKSSFMTGTVNPVEQGLTGQLAQMGGGVKPDRFTAKTTALNMVFPADVRQPDAIRELGRQIGGEGVGELLREHLSRSMEKTVKLTGDAGRMQQPFDFVKTIAGTNAQRQNLEAALQTTAESMGANPAEVRNGFYKLMRAFETTKDLELPATVDRAVLQQQAGLNAPGLLVAPQSRLGRVLWERATEKTFKQIADIIMSPDGLKQLQAIAKSPGYSAAGAYARSILSSSLEARPDQE